MKFPHCIPIEGGGTGSNPLERRSLGIPGTMESRTSHDNSQDRGDYELFKQGQKCRGVAEDTMEWCLDDPAKMKVSKDEVKDHN